MHRIILLSILYITLYITVANAEVTDCGSSAGKLTTLVTDLCNVTDTRCIISRGTADQPVHGRIETSFTIEKPIKSVKIVVFELMSGRTMPFTVAHPNACDDPNSGLNCPLSNTSAVYKHTMTVPIPFYHPRLEGTTLYKLQNEEDENIVCVSIPSKVV